MPSAKFWSGTEKLTFHFSIFGARILRDRISQREEKFRRSSRSRHRGCEGDVTFVVRQIFQVCRLAAR